MRELPDPQAVLDAIPDPPTCRALLARAIRQAAVLRRLITVSERTHAANKHGENPERGGETMLVETTRLVPPANSAPSPNTPNHAESPWRNTALAPVNQLPDSLQEPDSSP